MLLWSLDPHTFQKAQCLSADHSEHRIPVAVLKLWCTLRIRAQSVVFQTLLWLQHRLDISHFITASQEAHRCKLNAGDKTWQRTSHESPWKDIMEIRNSRRVPDTLQNIVSTALQLVQRRMKVSLIVKIWLAAHLVQDPRLYLPLRCFYLVPCGQLRFVNLVQAVLNYAKIFDLAYNVCFLNHWAEEVPGIIVAPHFIPYTRLEDFICYNCTATLYQKSADVHIIIQLYDNRESGSQKWCYRFGWFLLFLSRCQNADVLKEATASCIAVYLNPLLSYHHFHKFRHYSQTCYDELPATINLRKSVDGAEPIALYENFNVMLKDTTSPISLGLAVFQHF